MPTTTIAYDEAVHIPADVRDLNSFRSWAHSDEFPERGKITFIKGEIILDMSPAQISSHNKVQRDVQHTLGRLLDENDIGELLPDGTLFVNESANISTEPDLMFCRWDGLRSGRVSYLESSAAAERFIEVNGSPDMVLEAVSRSSVRKGHANPPLQLLRIRHPGILAHRRPWPRHRLSTPHTGRQRVHRC